MPDLSNEAMLAVLQERIAQAERRNDERHDALRIDQSEMENKLLNELGTLKLYQKEQNGNVAKVIGRVDALKERFDGHDDWHGKNDENLFGRLEAIEMAAHDNKVRHAVLVAEWKVLAAGIGMGGTISAIVFVGYRIMTGGF